MPLVKPPHSETELMQRALALAGNTLGQLSAQIFAGTATQSYHKGWTGQLLEQALGADASSLPVPDFRDIAVELKTLPLGINGIPRESTFVTSVALLTVSQQTWETSTVFNKLKRVLWIPIEGDPQIPLTQRRIGQAFLWSPSIEQERILRQDWQELTDMIAIGQLEAISARQGNYLQIRPKAANGKILCDGIDANGKKGFTLPRGFYLRTTFTRQLLGN